MLAIMFNKNKIYGLVALVPLLAASYFVIFSEKTIYQKLPFLNSLTAETRSDIEALKGFAFRLGLDLSSGVRLTYSTDLSKVEAKEQGQALDILRDVIERRVNAYGVSEPLVQIERSLSGESRLLVELPGLTNIDQAIKLIGETPTLEFKVERATGTERDFIIAKQKEYSQAVASGTQPVITKEIFEDPNFISIGLDGRFLKKSQLVFDQTTSVPQISIEWNEEGAKIFASTTKANIGKRIAIVLDGQVISAPTVNSAILDGKAVITGNYSGSEGKKEAKLLSQRLNTGALPVPVSIIGSEVVEPLLGAAALASGVKASLYGFLLIILMLLFWYRVPGIIGSISLLTYVFIMLAIFKLLPVTLSAAAIAGFIISIGLAVDGNILTFERLKEEIKKGKSIKDALDESFKRAWTSIRDSNIASLIVAVILFFIGTSVVKGFALTLMIGVLVSIFTNVVITKSLLKSIVPHKSGKFTKFFFKSPF